MGSELVALVAEDARPDGLVQERTCSWVSECFLQGGHENRANGAWHAEVEKSPN